MHLVHCRGSHRNARLVKPRAWLFLSLLFFMSTLFCIPAFADKSSETPLRVAFVFNFIKFIEWPAMDASQNIRLCVSTSDTATRSALQQLQGKAANKRAIELIYIKPDDLGRLDHCHMLYVTQAIADHNLPNPLPNGVVLVADEPQEQDQQVSIALLRNKDGRIEFAINADAVSHAGVNISSQLLKLAKNSRGGKG